MSGENHVQATLPGVCTYETNTYPLRLLDAVGGFCFAMLLPCVLHVESHCSHDNPLL
jgi:hypothetical protein